MEIVKFGVHPSDLYNIYNLHSSTQIECLWIEKLFMEHPSQQKCTCIYVYIHTYVYVYIYMYVYIHLCIYNVTQMHKYDFISKRK